MLPAIFCTQPGEFTALVITLPHMAASLANLRTIATLVLVVDDVPNVEVLFRQQYRMIVLFSPPKAIFGLARSRLSRGDLSASVIG